MHLARTLAATLTRTMTFADDSGPCRLHGNPDPGDIDRQKHAAAFPSEYASRLKGFAAPTIETEDPISFRDDVPTFKIRDLPTIGLTRADYSCIEIAPERSQLLA